MLKILKAKPKAKNARAKLKDAPARFFGSSAAFYLPGKGA